MQAHSTLVAPTTDTFISPAALLEHWQGHRRLTRRLIAAFPEDEFFKFSLGGMRPAAELVTEMIVMAVPGVRGVITGEWPSSFEMEHRDGKPLPSTKEEFLQRWDEETRQLDELWPQIPAHRFQENVVFFEQWPGTVYWALLYVIDNEIHHRAQAYVYLRALGIEPPFFYDRS